MEVNYVDFRNASGEIIEPSPLPLQFYLILVAAITGGAICIGIIIWRK